MKGIPFNQSEISSYLKELRRIKVMTPERERELVERLLSEDITPKEKAKIKKEMIEGNLRFVITISKEYQGQGMDFPDLVAEGNFGLAKAFDYFDWTRNTRFISYAVWWIRQSILQSLNESSRTIRIPVNLIQEMNKFKKETSKGEEPTEVQKFSGLPYTVNLDSPINEESDTLVDVIRNPNADPADRISDDDSNILGGKIWDVLKCLDEREKTIIEDYYGLTGPAKTLEDIGEELSLTKERVRQIKVGAIKKLRNRSHILFDYL